MAQIIFYSYVLLIAVLLLLLFLWKKYGARSILHPFSIFLVTWMTSFFVVPIYAALDFDKYFFNEEAVIQLFNFFSFTLMSMLFSVQIIPVRAKNRKLDMDFYAPKELLKWLTIFLLFVNIINIVFTRGSDLVENRAADVEMAIQIAETGRASLLYSVIAILNSLLTPILIFSGKEIINKIAYGKKYHLPFWAIISFVIVVMNTVTQGSRSAIIHSLITLILGAMLFYNFQAPFRIIAKKGIIIIAIVFSLFAAYATIIAEIRAEKSNHHITYIITNPNLAFLNGFMEYSFWHIWGYQYRIDDSFTEEPEGLRGNTFGFLTNLTFPFASQFGIHNNLGSVLGVEKPQQTRSIKAAAGITATVYFNLHDDLGYYGTFFAIFIFSLFSQYLFKWVITHRLRHITSLAVFVFVYGLWRYTWFHHLLGNINLVSLFIPYLLFEFIATIYKNQTKRQGFLNSIVYSNGLRKTPP